MELFQSARSDSETRPLAARMRPRTLDEFAGQDHILGPGRLLRRAIQADQLSSLIFYGPPGTGKTTLAMVIANTTKSSFETINAVLSGVKQIREAIDGAKEQYDLYGRRTILFVDEVHRWNKAQQDALLPWVENGTVILIGATTQNPYFEVNSALVSRSRIFQLKPLTREDLFTIARNALEDPERGYGKYNVDIEPEALEHIVDIAGGDARSVLNALELAVETTPDAFPPPAGGTIHIDLETAEESIQKKVVLYDKEGDYHFDTISAFIKSIRGSDPDAVLYWLAKMVRAGEDPKFIFRRMLIAACEDIGLADPNALVVTEAAAAAFERIGLPEGQFHLTQAALYLATAPKSNSALGYFDALQAVEEEEQAEVPNHLKDANRDKKGFGHGEGYKYPHAYRNHWVAQQYLPGPLQGRAFYAPGGQGYEGEVRNRVERRREAQLEAAFDQSGSGSPGGEICTFSPPDRQKERWIARTLEGYGDVLDRLREAVFEGLDIRRNDRVLDISPGSGMLMLEALRRVPEGGVFCIAPDSDAAALLAGRFSFLPEAERPVVISGDIASLSSPGTFECVIGRNPLTRRPDKDAVFEACRRLLLPGGLLSIVQVIPSKGQRLSELYRTVTAGTGGGSGTVVGNGGTVSAYSRDGPGGGDSDRTAAESGAAELEAAEEIIYQNSGNPLVNWDEQILKELCSTAGFEILEAGLIPAEETRTLTEKNILRWFDPDQAELGYGRVLSEQLSSNKFETLQKNVIRRLAGRSAQWKSVYLLLRARA